VPERNCGPVVCAGRLRKAREFRLAAELVEDGAVDGKGLNDAYITMCVHAGIAAADVVCCRRLGVSLTPLKWSAADEAGSASGCQGYRAGRDRAVSEHGDDGDIRVRSDRHGGCLEADRALAGRDDD
jgi:hypothetical protein